MNILTIRDYSLIILSFIIWMILSIIPFGKYWIIVKPDFVALSLVYWAVFLPRLVGIIFAFVLGVFWDLLIGNPLGTSSLSFVLLVYISGFLRVKLNSTCLWQQALSILALVASYKLLMLWSNLFIANIKISPSYWLSVVSSIFFWPLTFIITQYYQRAFALR